MAAFTVWVTGPDMQDVETMAHQIGLRPETLYRTLALLHRSGLVARRGRRVWLAGESSSDHAPRARGRARARRT